MKIKENITKLSLVKFTLLLLLSIAFCIPLHAQIVKGKVVDAKTKESLPFVHIGVYNQNVGVISDDLGNFRINLKNMSQSDSLVFSIIGYADKAIKISDLDNNFNEVTMDAFSYQIKPIVVTPEDNAPIKNYGLVKPSKTTIGQSGIKDFGFGGEWGILIKNEGDTYLMESIHFHTRFNTMDSVLFRMNVYEVSNGMPGRSLLDKEVFTKSYKKAKWIRAELGDNALFIKQDIIVTFEVIRIWYSDKGENALFYTYAKGQGKSYAKASSFASWEVDQRPTLTIYVSGKVIE